MRRHLSFRGSGTLLRPSNLFIAVLGIMLFAGGAHADPITYTIAGVFDFSGDPLLPVGSSYTGTLTFDPATLVPSVDSIGGVRYSYGTVFFTTGSVTLSGLVTISIDSARDWVRIDHAVGLQGAFFAGFRMNLLGAGLTSDQFPDPFPTLSDFTFGQLIVHSSNLNTASVTSFAPGFAAPTLNAPPNRMIIGCNLAAIGALGFSATPVSITLDQLQGEGGNASAQCGIQSLTYRDELWGSCPALVVNRTFSVSDGCGGSASARQTITFGDPRPRNGADLALSDLTYFLNAWPPNGFWSVPVIAFWEVSPSVVVTNFGPTREHVSVEFEMDEGFRVLRFLPQFLLLEPGESRRVTSDRRRVEPGDYIVRAIASPVSSDPNPSNNVVEEPLSLHDR